VIWAAVHSNLEFFEKQRLKERKAHQMIPVGMGKDKIKVVAFFVVQVGSQPANSGPGIHNNNVAALALDFNTGRVTAILQILLA
jgi:hypothetical protein